VLGVAAVNRENRPSQYSNKGDFVAFGNGVATFGGDAKRPAIGSLPKIAVAGLKNEEVDAIAGLFSAGRLPLDGSANDTGWAYWAGTSFAAPVASAIAANVWATAGAALDAPMVLDAVRNYTVTPLPDLDSPSIPARQEYVGA
jgi:hypothetical protein